MAKIALFADSSSSISCTQANFQSFSGGMPPESQTPSKGMCASHMHSYRPILQPNPPLHIFALAMLTVYERLNLIMKPKQAIPLDLFLDQCLYSLWDSFYNGLM